jgi:hypothetical protein
MTLPAVDPLPRADADTQDDGDGFSPTMVVEVELTEPLPTVRGSEPCCRVSVLARLHTEPVGMCVAPLGPGGIVPDRLAALLWRELREPIAERFVAAGVARG